MKYLIFLSFILNLNVTWAKNTIVVMNTSKGELEIELFDDKAPNTVKNFLDYVDSKFYEGTIFHRVINNFMIQGGGFTKDLTEKLTKPTIKNEADNGLANEIGTIAMARTMDPHSASSQFFINVVDNSYLNHTSKSDRGWGYCVFGKVLKGMYVVNNIKQVKTGIQKGMSDVPTDPVIINFIKRK